MTIHVRPPGRGSLGARVELLISSFAPLFAILGVRLWDRRLWGAAFLILAVWGLGVLARLLWLRRTRAPDLVVLDRVEDLGDQVAGHVTGYLLPLLVPVGASIGDLLLTTVTLLLIATILVQSNRVHLNPLLYLFGFRIYSATAGTKTYYLIAKSEMSSQSGDFAMVEVDRSIALEKPA